jgi:LacI family transcriptional regulator, galactose operon repressor
MAMKALSKATIYQVAQLAGVSIATVSRALRDSELVTPQTRERVRQAARDLQFTPSRLGRSLAEGRHAANGIVFPDLVGPYYAEVVLGYEAAAAGFGSSVVILATHGRDDAASAVRDLAARVDGLTIMGQTVGDDVVAGLARTGLPLVLLARDPVPGVDTVRARNDRTARALVEHLLAHGHRRFVFFGDPDGAPDVVGRYQGVAKGLSEHGLDVPDPVRLPGFDLEAGRGAARELLREERPDAVICANDEVALGVLLAAEEQGLGVPQDLAVTGWDDLLAARFAGLTTVRQPMRDLGATAARWLDQRIKQDGPTPPKRRILPTRLVVRRSCGTHSPEVHPT